MIEGTFRIWREQEVFDVGPGGIALLPRHQAHTFRNVGADPGRLLTVIIPAGFERLFEVIAARGLGPDDAEAIDAVAADWPGDPRPTASLRQDGRSRSAFNRFEGAPRTVNEPALVGVDTA